MLLSGALAITIIVLFVFTDPNRVPSFVLVLPFILLFILLLSLIVLILQKRGMYNSKTLRIGMLCAAIPLVLLILQSIGQLTIRDVLAIAALFAISYFYMSRISISS